MDLLAWGSNSHGQCGFGWKCYSLETPAIAMTSRRCEIFPVPNIKAITGGGAHSMTLTRTGELYSCGWNERGQLGFWGVENYRFKKIEYLVGQRFEQISCGWDFSSATTDQGLGFVWGSNEFGQLGVSNETTYIHTPVCLPANRVSQVACGLRHMMVVLESGKVLASGQGTRGQLGIRKMRDAILEPVPELDNVAQVACGQFHCLALCKDGSVFSWGCNKYGQLGVSPSVTFVQEIPVKMETDFFVSSIATGWTHSILQNTEGEIFTCGRNNYGQLGRDNVNTSRLTKVECEKVDVVFAGSEHNVALTESKKVLTWGWNEHGNCGDGSPYHENINKPMQIKLQKPAHLIGCGASHNFVVV